ncbi:MAG: hypothetical protein ACRED1_08190, partial [Limisphaerales bacterium]
MIQPISGLNRSLSAVGAERVMRLAFSPFFAWDWQRDPKTGRFLDGCMTFGGQGIENLGGAA